MYMNFSMVSIPSAVDFIVYPDLAGAACNPYGIIYGPYPHSAGLDYYSQLSCIDKSRCNITGTVGITAGVTCFAFYNKYYKGPTIVSYYLTVNCSQLPIQLSTMSISTQAIQGPGDTG